jgi:hypothetical protein
MPLGIESWIFGLGPWVLDRGSWIVDTLLKYEAERLKELET